MTIDYATAILFAVGHVLAMILVLNTSHGLGINAPWIDRAVLALLVLAGLVGLGLVACVWGQPWTAWPIPIRAYSLGCFGIALIGLPATTLSRSFRRLPEGSRLLEGSIRDFRHESSSTPKGEGPLAAVLSLPGNTSLQLSMPRWEVVLPDWPTALDGLSILHLSDLHFARCYPRRYFEWAIAAAADGPEPDLIAITGDFMDDEIGLSWVEPILGPLSARLGRFAILGNHDYRNDFRGLRRALRRGGYRVLEGKWATLPIGESRLAIGGTTFPWGKDLGRRETPAADAKVLLSHSPDQVYRAATWGVDLMLAGHVHGGQGRLPIVGPVLMPSVYSRRFDRGSFRVGPTTLFVNQGLGAKVPLRIGCMPEIAHLTLRSPRARAKPIARHEGRTNLAGTPRHEPAR